MWSSAEATNILVHKHKIFHTSVSLSNSFRLWPDYYLMITGISLLNRSLLVSVLMLGKPFNHKAILMRQ
jgi:hypothetical protein